jgi:hypothetical protein
MATTEGINRHDNLIEQIVEEFAGGLKPLFDDIFANLANNPNPDRTAILALFFPMRQYILSRANDLDRVAASNTQMNRDVIDQQLDAAAQTVIQTLKSETSAAVLTAVDQEQQSLIQTLAIAAIAGAGIALVLRDLRKTISKSIARLSKTFRTLIRNFDGAFTLVRATVNPDLKFRYVGGVIQTSRGFCRSHNNKVYTRKQIETIWRGNSWGGKSPGNPFIVRGGYNCRHFFVPVVEERNRDASA